MVGVCLLSIPKVQHFLRDTELYHRILKYQPKKRTGTQQARLLENEAPQLTVVLPPGLFDQLCLEMSVHVATLRPLRWSHVSTKSSGEHLKVNPGTDTTSKHSLTLTT